MATTAEDIRAELEKKAGQRINPLLKGLSMLTGGLAGEFTGTNEQIREQRRAKAAMLEEQQRTMQEERISERMRLQRQLMLEEDLKRAEAARQAATLGETRRLQGETMVARGEDATMVGPLDPETALGVARARAAAAKDPRRAQLIGALSAERGPLEVLAEQQGLTTPIADLDINALERMNAAMTASIEAKKREPKGLSMQLMTPRGMVYGTYDELASKYPNEVKNIMEAKPEKTKDIEPSVRATYDEYGNVKPLVDFPPGYPIEKQEEFLGRVRKAYNISQEGMVGVPASGTPKIIGKGPAGSAGAPQVSRFGGATTAAATPSAAVPATAQATSEPSVLGPFLMQEYNKMAKQLASESGRVPYTRSTDPLMIPMYENIAKELGVQPQQIGASRLSTRPYKVVESNLNQYLGQFGQLPQDVQNQAVMDALNQAMQKRRYREQEGAMYESPFNK